MENPRVGILLYCKHLITHQAYIPQLIRYFEEVDLIPVLIFINGVEGHVTVRDLMTTGYEQAQRALGNVECASLSKEAVQVDAIVVHYRLSSGGRPGGFYGSRTSGSGG